LFLFHIDAIESPSNLKLAVNGTSIEASWDPIPDKLVFGKLIGYRVRLRKYSNWHSRYFYTNATSIALKTLQQGALYKIEVTGYTANETGVRNYAYAFTGNKYLFIKVSNYNLALYQPQIDPSPSKFLV